MAKGVKKWIPSPIALGNVNLYSHSLQLDRNAFSFDSEIPLPEICSKKIIGHPQKGVNVSIFAAAFLK